MTYPETEFYLQKCAVKREGYQLKNPVSLISLHSFIVKNPFKHDTSVSTGQIVFALVLISVSGYTTAAFG